MSGETTPTAPPSLAPAMDSLKKINVSFYYVQTLFKTHSKEYFAAVKKMREYWLRQRFLPLRREEEDKFGFQALLAVDKEIATKIEQESSEVDAIVDRIKQMLEDSKSALDHQAVLDCAVDLFTRAWVSARLLQFTVDHKTGKKPKQGNMRLTIEEYLTGPTAWVTAQAFSPELVEEWVDLGRRALWNEAVARSTPDENEKRALATLNGWGLLWFVLRLSKRKRSHGIILEGVKGSLKAFLKRALAELAVAEAELTRRRVRPEFVPRNRREPW